MELPRDSSDIQIVLACLTCNGNGGMGIRGDRPDSKGSNPFSSCSTCNGTGWTLKRPKDITAMELARLVQRLPQLAPLPSGRDILSQPSSSMVGSIVEAGDDAEGQPRMTIHTTREELKKCELIAFYHQARITFEPIAKQPA